MRQCSRWPLKELGLTSYSVLHADPPPADGPCAYRSECTFYQGLRRKVRFDKQCHQCIPWDTDQSAGGAHPFSFGIRVRSLTPDEERHVSRFRDLVENCPMCNAPADVLVTPSEGQDWGLVVNDAIASRTTQYCLILRANVRWSTASSGEKRARGVCRSRPHLSPRRWILPHRRTMSSLYDACNAIA